MLISSQCVCSNHFYYAFCLPGGRTNRIKWKAKQLFVPVQLERVCVCVENDGTMEAVCDYSILCMDLK